MTRSHGIAGRRDDPLYPSTRIAPRRAIRTKINIPAYSRKPHASTRYTMQ